MLQDIRDKSQGIVVKIIVGFIVVTFALFGVDALVTSFNSSETVAEVDGIDISRTQVLQTAETQRRQLIAMMGSNVNPELLEDSLLQRRALDELIQRAVLENQVNELGLGISDAQVDMYLLQAEQFQTNGQFDQNKYLSFLQSLGYSPLAFKERVKQDVLIQQSRNAIAGSEFVLPYQVESVSELQAQTRSYDYVSFSLADESERTNVSDDEILSYYEEHKEGFKTPEQVKIDYVLISSNDFYGDLSVTESELESAYEASITGLGREERQASHILLEVPAKSDAEAQLLVDEIQAKLDAGESFADLASQYSDDIGSKDNGGDLGYLEKGAGIDNVFDNALFAMSEGDIQVVKSSFGYHFILLNDVVKEDIPSLASKKEELEKTLLQAKARDALLTAHEDITDLAYASDKLDVLAKEYGVEVLQSSYFGREGGSEGIISNPSVIAASFGVSVLEDDQNSDLIEISDDQVVVVRLNDHKDESYQAFDEVKDQITSLVVQSKALVSLQERAETAKSSSKTKWVSVEGAKRGQDEITSQAFSLPHPDGKAVIDVKSLANGDLVLIRLKSLSKDAEPVTEERTLAYQQYLNQVQVSLATQGQQSLLQSKADIQQ